MKIYQLIGKDGYCYVQRDTLEEINKIKESCSDACAFRIIEIECKEFPPKKPTIDWTKPLVNGYGHVLTYIGCNPVKGVEYPRVCAAKDGGIFFYSDDGNNYVFPSKRDLKNKEGV